MAQWPSDWRDRTLRAAGIIKSQFALDVLSAWQRSTPVEPWTNNPLGMPAGYATAPPAMKSRYAAFPTMQAFYTAFKQSTSVREASQVKHALIMADSLSETWREIHAMKWPGNDTEADYPHVLLDMVEAKYRDKVTSRTSGQSDGTGVVQASSEAHASVRRQANALSEVAGLMLSGSKAIEHIMRRSG